MKSSIDEWKSYLWEEAKGCSFESGYVVGCLNTSATDYWEKFKKTYFPANPQKFKQQLSELLVSKLNQMPDVTMDRLIFDKLTNEMYKLLSCSLSSNRTPEEIISALQSDAEMREEVVSLLLSKIDSPSSLDSQRMFLTRILSGDEDLRVLLDKQKENKQFPRDIWLFCKRRTMLWQ